MKLLEHKPIGLANPPKGYIFMSVVAQMSKWEKIPGGVARNITVGWVLFKRPDWWGR